MTVKELKDILAEYGDEYEIETWSPAGEDLIEYLDKEDIIENVKKYNIYSNKHSLNL